MNKTNKRSGTLRRLLSYIVRNSRWMFAVVCIAVVLSTAASVLGSMFTQVVIDDYITPLLTAGNPDYSGLRNAILGMGCIYLIGVICTVLYNRLMVTISQGCLKHIRDDMFYHMQSLPISYFDTHTHGDVMSHYTNDTDTLRQFISNALAQLIACLITALASFIVMICYSRALALIVIAVTVIDVFITLARLLHLDVECVTRFAIIRGCSRKFINACFFLKHIDFCPCPFSETGQRPCSYL